MSVKIRLARGGAKKQPFYRIVAASHTSARDGKFIEKLGTYSPLLPKENAQRVELNKERVAYWLSAGATPSETVKRFLAAAGLYKDKSKAKRSTPPAKKGPRKEAKKAA